MLRVGLTGELGSGKSTVARMLADRGAVVLSSDEIARRMMQPGHPVYRGILEAFGPGVVLPGGSLNRKALAALAFDAQFPRIEELNEIVHPPVIAAQERRMATLARQQPHAIVVVESALIFTTRYSGGGGSWEHRFDRVLLVTAPDALKISRFISRVTVGAVVKEAERSELEMDARRRLAAQHIPASAVAGSIVLENHGDLSILERRVDEIFPELARLAASDKS